MRITRAALARLHADESGLKTLEVVAILAIAAIILAVIKLFWYRVQNWFVDNTADVDQGWDGAAGGEAPGGP